MNILEKLYKKNYEIEKKFSHKKILYIGSESYDAATITIIEGLHKLGFSILTYKKPNINSMPYNSVIQDISNIENKVDFILSNLHWGTRWSLYKQFTHSVPYILIDGDDRQTNSYYTWKDKYNQYTKIYKNNPPDNNKDMDVPPYRWVETIGGYKPDVVFTSQKFKNDKDCIYLPFGINDSYFNVSSGKKTRDIDIVNIPGPGHVRNEMNSVVDTFKHEFNGKKIFNEKIYGDKIYPHDTISYCKKDSNNINSYHRWGLNKNYFNVLNTGKIFIYPHGGGGFESKRPYEAMAAGCLILFQISQDSDISEYPVEELCDISEFSYRNYEQLKDVCRKLLNDEKYFEEKRDEYHNNALKYFTSVPITRYFLSKIM